LILSLGAVTYADLASSGSSDTTTVPVTSVLQTVVPIISGVLDVVIPTSRIPVKLIHDIGNILLDLFQSISNSNKEFLVAIFNLLSSLFGGTTSPATNLIFSGYVTNLLQFGHDLNDNIYMVFTTVIDNLDSFNNNLSDATSIKDVLDAVVNFLLSTLSDGGNNVNQTLKVAIQDLMNSVGSVLGLLKIVPALV